MPGLGHFRVYVAGHTGLVGSALVRRLSRLEGAEIVSASHAELDLTDGRAVEDFLRRARPDIVIVAAGRVGGILANSLYPAEFIYENLMIETNLIHSCWKAGVRRVLNFGSACMYPKHCRQPMTPDQLMSGKLEPTSEPYAVAKLAGLFLCSAYGRQYGVSFMTAIPCNLYGPGDTFDPISAHMIPALIQKFHKARTVGEREVVLWGDGSASRELLYVDDLADACEHLLRLYEGTEPVNIGSGESYTIRQVAEIIAEVVGFEGEIRWDPSRPEGAHEKLLDSTAIRRLGWSPRVGLRSGVERTYRWFLDHTEV